MDSPVSHLVLKESQKRVTRISYEYNFFKNSLLVLITYRNNNFDLILLLHFTTYTFVSDDTRCRDQASLFSDHKLVFGSFSEFRVCRRPENKVNLNPKNG